MANLTEKQALFLELLFSDEFINNPKGAKEAAGYSDKTSLDDAMAGIQQEILKKTEAYLALHLPKALHSVISVLDTPHAQGAKTKLDAAHSILDRAGLSKRERLDVEVKAPSGIVFLPAKSTE